jgi:hypothetical protein
VTLFLVGAAFHLLVPVIATAAGEGCSTNVGRQPDRLVRHLRLFPTREKTV